MRPTRHAAIAAALAGIAFPALTASATDGVRVAAWNITFYNGGDASDIQNTVYGVFDSRSLAPDVILLQEMSNLSALNSLVTHLNGAAGSPGDWAAAPYFTASTSGGINTGLVYRTSRFDLLGAVVVKPGTSGQNPRNVVRYDLRLEGYTSEEATFSMYPIHMKAGSSSSDQSRRLIEANAIIGSVNGLPAERNKIVGGDFNTQSSTQAAFVAMIGNPWNTGPLRDPINRSGSWNNNSTYRAIHTQDPAGNGGMDDRHDILFASPNMNDGAGVEYIGDFTDAWNLATWNDPDHSYRVWGNDGTSYNVAMTTIGNVNVGASIAQSVINLAGNTGHCPVYFDAQVPAKIGTDTVSIDFGDVDLGDTGSVMIGVGSFGDTALWGSLIEQSTYSFSNESELVEPVGPFNDDAGGALNMHQIDLTDTGVEGPINGTLTVSSNDPDTPSLVIPWSATIVSSGCSPADVNGDGILDNGDIQDFLTLFLGGDLAVDFNGDGILDNADISEFVTLFLAGC